MGPNSHCVIEAETMVFSMRRMMRTLFAALAMPMALIAGCAAPSAAQTAPQSGAVEGVEISYGEWRDDVRDRSVPYKLYLPRARTPAPIVIFSHGLGGNREAASYLLEHLAANGFAAVAIQHPGTDESLLREGRGMERLRESVTDARSAAARFSDVGFVIDQLERANASGALAGRFDISRIGMSGHSYGALTTLIAVGQRPSAGAPDRFRDPRIDAAIVYSPNAPRNQDPGAALADIRTPILHMTGTDDRTPLDLERTPAERQIPFRTISGADQFLIVFDGGDHMIFSGRVQRSGQMNVAQQAQTEAILRESLTFWRAYLLQDGHALAALCGLPQRIDPIGVAEVKASRCG
jgi:predicted dienelactone hydrolase